MRAAESQGDAKNKALHDLLQRDGLCTPDKWQHLDALVRSRGRSDLVDLRRYRSLTESFEEIVILH